MSINTQINLLKKRRTKIIATLGPASSDPDNIRALIKAGVNLFRQNMSHGDHTYHQQVYAQIRQIAQEEDQTIGILADLCGPKIRTGKFKNGFIELKNNSTVIITTRAVEGEAGLIPSQYTALANDVKTGDSILLADGLLELKVDEIKATEISCTVIHGGKLSDYKGINLPGVTISAPSLTEKDKADAALALELGVDFIALSFVRSAIDIKNLRALIDANHHCVQVIAKIEKPEALTEIDAIIDAVDGIMVARGDLGVELSPEQVPVVQHRLIDLARKQCKPVIVATQMLESMIKNARPTRAEVTDVAHAVTLGTDAIMLSGETAVGDFPIAAVQMMDKIARQTESYLWSHNNTYQEKMTEPLPVTPLPIWKAVANSMAQLAQDLKTRAVIVISDTGMSAATMSSVRPSAPIIAITNQTDICRKMMLIWGIIPILVNDIDHQDINELARAIACKENIATSGETILLVRGFHQDKHLNIPSVTVLTL